MPLILFQYQRDYRIMGGKALQFHQAGSAQMKYQRLRLMQNVIHRTRPETHVIFRIHSTVGKPCHGSALSSEWLKAGNNEMTGHWRRNVFERVRRDSFDPADKVFSRNPRRSHNYKIKRKGGHVDKCQVRLVLQVQIKVNMCT